MFRQIAFACLGAVGLALLISGTANAKPPLSQHSHINAQLYVGAIAKALSDACPSVEARMIKVRTDALALYNYALQQGYTRREISDYLESKPDIAKMEARRDRYLTSRGVRLDDPDSYCSQAEAEIASNTTVGALLRAR